ncbi:MAG: hypothetical protein LBQ01_05385 [Prevotellaceae bacterium]|nr:hypothetical protein [Prevotellaceae bacterium]
MQIFIFTVILLALCVAGIGVRIWIKGEFTEHDTGRNKNMKKLGINCVKNEEMEQHNSRQSNSVCSACSFSGSCSKKS